MVRKIEINYIRKFDFCDRGHFMIAKGFVTFLGLAAYILECLGTPQFRVMRQIAMALFLFCSGFGVSESFERKRGLYHYWENKFIKVWIPSLIALIIVYTVKYLKPIIWIGDSPLGLKHELLYVVFGNYLVFWLLFSFFESKAVKVTGLFLVAVAVFFFVRPSIRPYLLAFPTGALISQAGWKRSVRKFRWRGLSAIILISGGIAVGGWLLQEMVATVYVNGLLKSVMLISGAIFVGTVIYALQIIPIFGAFAPFGYMGYIMFLIYADVFKMVLGNDKNDWRLYMLAVGALVVISLVGSWLINRLAYLNRELRNRSKTHIKGSMRR